MTQLSGLFDWQSGIPFGLILIAIMYIFKVLKAYALETRQEYISRLNETTIELEREKTRNHELRLEIRYLKTMQRRMIRAKKPPVKGS